MRVDFAFEALQERHGVGGGTRKAGNDAAAGAEPPHLARVGLHDRAALGHLAVANDGDGVAAADGEDGGCAPAVGRGEGASPGGGGRGGEGAAADAAEGTRPQAGGEGAYAAHMAGEGRSGKAKHQERVEGK